MTQQPLTLPAPSYSDDIAAFDNDLFRRSVLASQIEQFLPRLTNGAVIAIDSQWGAGKTWFGMNWAKSLKANGHKVAFINAFEQDYTEDPFLPIAAELSGLLDTGGGKALLKKAAKVASACLPVGAKMATSAVSKLVFGNMDIPDTYEKAIHAVEDKSEEFVQHWVERKLTNYKQEQESLRGFRSALTEMATKESKPVVVFVDELDRCRPDFSVRLIERIKHFFETPNVIFVLLIHRDQLNRAISGVYGASTDGAAYLSKFIHFFFTLPASNVKIFIDSTLRRLGLDDNDSNNFSFTEYLSIWHVAAGLTLRDIERGCALYAYAKIRGASGLLAYLITMKIKRPDLFDGILSENRTSHQTSREWVGQLRNAHAADRLIGSEVGSNYFNAIDQAHRAFFGENVKINVMDLGREIRAQTAVEMFRVYSRQIDLPID